ncbi:hypothetical protein PAXRUDRAFT_789418, partial [Paxillus rubicundulus Ve08.2h10]
NQITTLLEQQQSTCQIAAYTVLNHSTIILGRLKMSSSDQSTSGHQEPSYLLSDRMLSP